MHLKLLDNGKFEPSNLNRQIFCFTDTDGRQKTDVTEEYLKKINPEIKIEKYLTINEQNADDFLKGTDVIVLSIDAVIPCLILSRRARMLGIPLVEGWALAFANVRVFTQDTPTLEEVYRFPTIGRDISSVSKEEAFDLMIQSLLVIKEQFKGVGDYYPDSALKRLPEENKGTTLCPCVWLTAIMMANEAMKIILKRGKLALAPKFAVYDPFNHQIPEQVI